MQQSFRKIKRVQPLVKLKKTRVDEELAVLALVRAEKVEIVRSMKESQTRYMSGVDELNKIRTSPARKNLDNLEEALDYVKLQWYKMYKKVQEVEKKEKQQIEQLLAAERELKSVEKLREKYELEFALELKRADQKMIDEVALRKYVHRQ